MTTHHTEIARQETMKRDKAKYSEQWSDSTMPITPEEGYAYEAGHADGWTSALAWKASQERKDD